MQKPRKTFVIMIVFLFLASTVTLQPVTVKAQSRTIVVPDDYSTIGAAVANAVDGDSLYVKCGTYQEDATLIINKTISLIGQNIANTTLILNPPYGEVKGLHLAGGGVETEYGYYDGMKIVADNVRLSGFTVICETSSIVASGSRTQIINNNLTTGLFLMDGMQRSIVGNTIRRDITSESADTTIANNTLGSLLSLGTNVRIKNNLVFSSNLSNCAFYVGSNSQVEGNIIFGQYGMAIRGQGNTIFNNMVVNTKIALTFDMDANNNLIYHNNFINNTVAAQMSSLLTHPSVAAWDKGPEVGGNYWSDYLVKYPNASEIGDSGLGNIPYTIDGNNQDMYPLLRPLNITLDSLSTLPFSIYPLPVKSILPKINILSPADLTYNESNVPLVFSVDKQIDRACYSLDGNQNVTAAGNCTLTDLANGAHNITVYANDTFGDTAASNTITFFIDSATLGTTEPEPYPTVFVAAVSVAGAAVATACLFIYHRTRQRKA